MNFPYSPTRLGLPMPRNRTWHRRRRTQLPALPGKLEDTLNYKGSLVSLYYSTYNTGIYKCCNTVYDPPTRNYCFDLDFTTPGGLPPGTPMFRDVESLGYRQLFTTRTSSN